MSTDTANAAPAPDEKFLAMVRSRHAGDPRAVAELGARLIVGKDAPQSLADGLALLNEAAQLGDAYAWHRLAVLAAAGVGRTQSWADTYAALQRAVAQGHKGARREQQLFSALGLSTPDKVHAWLTTFDTRVLHESPRFAAHARLLPLALCKYLIEHARPRLRRATVSDALGGGQKIDPMRTNQTAVYSLIDSDVVMQLARARIARAANVPFNHLEPVEILHYAGGETYRPHVDFFHPSLKHYAGEMRTRGQRVKTCLVYLNAGYEDGETDFPKLNIRFRGEVGEALVFDSIGADGAVDVNTVHTGLPPKDGVKWLLSQWMRERAQTAL